MFHRTFISLSMFVSQVFIVLAGEGCIDINVQRLCELADADSSVNIHVTEEGFSFSKDGQCYEAKYTAMLEPEKSVYDQLVRMAREEWLRDEETQSKERRNLESRNPGCG